ncbi:hypothetical protein V6N11_000132 [Hibiscus sabdariffa]|uniref:CCHC-type domain-containing protein n=1 Tax=Hibiscus sabdariffa TaxID=183260 RepID=A0ABR2NP97_9ROSI
MGKGVQDDDPSSKISKAMMIQKVNHHNPLSSLLKVYGETMIPKISTFEDQVTESSISSESESSEDSYDSSDDRIMATNQPEVKEEYAEDEPMETTTSSTNQPPISNTGAKYNFTIDDIPVTKWAQRFQEFHSWMETRKLTKESHYDILVEFVSRFTGVLRDWWGTTKVLNKLSYPQYQRNRKHILQLTVGEIQQETFTALEELCDRKRTIKEYLTGTKELDKACKTPGLTIKCKKQESCNCKRRTFHGDQRSKRRSRLPRFPNLPRRKGRWRYLRKKRRPGVKSTKCIVCGKSGHFAKSCPKNKKGAKMIQQIQEQTRIIIPENDDVESIFSIEDELSDQSLFAIQALDEEPEDVDADWSSETIYMLQHRISTNNISSIVPIPHVQAAVYLKKYDKPIPTIAFIDIGAAKSIMNPDVLPKEWWKPHVKYFSSALDQIFKTTLISKPITIQFFPGCSIKTTILGSSLPGKDLVMGFDLYTKMKHLRILPTGIKYKGMYKTFVEIPRLFLTSPLEVISTIVKELKDTTCSDSHADFLTKCHHPLWKNVEFFVKLPFKKNEDINPTRASHSGMNPDHQRLAEAECKELLQQDLIEPSDSQWSCEAFYVNKRSEQARGKLRLVINYQPLNHFLQDDKFLLPNRNILFSSLANY